MSEQQTKVTELRPADTLALFYSIDDEPKFAVTFCAEPTLEAAVYACLFGEVAPSAHAVVSEDVARQYREAEDTAAALLEKGEVRFEDGWLRLGRGMAGAVEFMARAVNDARSDMRFEDRRRYEALQRAEHFAKLYKQLLEVVGAALGARLGVAKVQVEQIAAVEAFERPGLALRWAVGIFGLVASDRTERALRFGEESLEVLHRQGVTREQLDKLAERVFNRPAGELGREIGQAALTLELLAENAGVSVAAEAAREFDRVRAIPREEWQRRHQAKVELGIAS